MHVRGRGQPGQLEPGESPQAQSFGHQRVPAALRPVLRRRPVRPAVEGEPVRPATPFAVRPAHRDRDPRDRGRDEAELVADSVRAGVGVVLGRLAGTRWRGDVEVDEHGPVGRQRVDQLRQAGSGRAFPGVGHGRDDQVVPPVVGVLGSEQRTAAPLGDPDVPQRPDPVVPPGHHLEHDGVVPLGEDAEDGFAGCDDGVNLGGLGRERQAIAGRVPRAPAAGPWPARRRSAGRRSSGNGPAGPGRRWPGAAAGWPTPAG